jgi:hypothetical protein
VPAARAGTRLFVAGHDPERGGRLAYRGRVGIAISMRDARAAFRLATANALVSARAAVGPLERLRCVAVTAFVSTAVPEALDPALLGGALALVATALPAAGPPAVWLRPAQGLAAGIPVEVELLLDVRTRETAAPLSRLRSREAPAGARAHRRFAGRTS